MKISLLLLIALLVLLTANLVQPPPTLAGQSSEVPLDGSVAREACVDFKSGVLPIDIPDPGWVWVKRAVSSAPQYRSVTGIVTRSEVSYTDFPDAHDSHDMNVDVLVDLGQEDILSDAGKDNASDARTGYT
jgi:hypothetical protein